MSGSQTLMLGHRPLGNPVFRFVGFVLAASLRHRQRQTLGRLDHHLLRDIGLNADMAAQECAKPFWRD